MLKSFTTFKKDEILSLAIGGFDGVHLAHQQLASRLTEPGVFLVIDRGGIGLTPAEERCHYIDIGCFIVGLDTIKQISADDFISFLKENFPHLQKIVVGYDFRFGKDRQGDGVFLRANSDFEVEVVDEITIDGISVHSRTIKQLLQEGNISLANRLLGRAYRIKGIPIAGQGIGKQELVATINLQIGDFFLPKEGVYATWTEIGEERYASVTFIGKRETTDGNFSIETHLLEREIDFIPQEVVGISLIGYIRKNQKFETLQALKMQIEEDISVTKKLLRL